MLAFYLFFILLVYVKYTLQILPTPNGHTLEQ